MSGHDFSRLGDTIFPLELDIRDRIRPTLLLRKRMAHPALGVWTVSYFGDEIEGRGLQFKLRNGRLNRLLKNSFPIGFVSGHDFSRADKPFIFVVPSGL